MKVYIHVRSKLARASGPTCVRACVHMCYRASVRSYTSGHVVYACVCACVWCACVCVGNIHRLLGVYCVELNYVEN